MTPTNGETSERLVRIEVKLDQALTSHADHESRIRTLERARWPLPSVAVVVSVASLLGNLLGLFGQ